MSLEIRTDIAGATFNASISKTVNFSLVNYPGIPAAQYRMDIKIDHLRNEGKADYVESYNVQVSDSGKGSFVLPSNALKNKPYDYYMFIKLYKIPEDTIYAETFDPDVFSCRLNSKTTFIYFPSDNTIYMPTHTFYFKYEQDEKIPIVGYTWSITYRDGRRFQSGVVRDIVDGTPPYTGDLFVEGLKNDQDYIIKIVPETNFGDAESVAKEFSVRYTRPLLEGKITLQNNCKEGYVTIIAEAMGEEIFDKFQLRRRVQNFQADEKWVVLKELDGAKGRIIDTQDYIAASGVPYEYALVGIKNNLDSNFIVEVNTLKYDSVFITGVSKEDNEIIVDSFKLLGDVNYDSVSRVQKTGVFEPLGKRHPIVIMNGDLNYETGNVSAIVLTKEFVEEGIFNKNHIRQLNSDFKLFLANKSPKILKDWNGNIFIISVTSNITNSYLPGPGMGVPKVQFDWTEVGDVTSQKDLFDSGILIDTTSAIGRQFRPRN